MNFLTYISHSKQVNKYVWYIPRSGIAGSLNNLLTWLHKLYFHEHYMKISVTPCQHFNTVHSIFFIFAIMASVDYNLLWLEFSFPWWIMMLSNFSCLMAIWISSSWRVSSSMLPIFQLFLLICRHFLYVLW